MFGNSGHGGRYILDSLKVPLTCSPCEILFTIPSPQQTGAVATDYYRDSDLTVGGVVNLWGRKLLLCDCDQFTKEYYSSKYGIGTLRFLPVVHDVMVSSLPPDTFRVVDMSEPTPPPQPRQLPPYNGFGSQEDSLASCLNLIPKAPRRYAACLPALGMLSLASFRDFKKFMERDRHGLESNVLRFVARMDTTRPIDMDRRFIVFFHLSDDTIAVFEPPQRNSGTYCTESLCVLASNVGSPFSWACRHYWRQVHGTWPHYQAKGD